MTDIFRSHCYALFLTAATSDPYLWCAAFVLFCFRGDVLVFCCFASVFSPPALEEKGDGLIDTGREMRAITCPKVNTVSASISSGSWIQRGGQLHRVAEPLRWAGTSGDPLALPRLRQAQPEQAAQGLGLVGF